MWVRADEERELLERALVACGTPAKSAAVQAGWLVEADLRAQPSHGIRRLAVLVERVRNGLIDPEASPRTSWSGPSVLVVDGARGFGPVVGSLGVELAIERVGESGAVVVAVHNANHLGILAPYVEAFALAGCIGVACTTSEALVHPFGGRTAMLGTNPIAIAVPASPHPFVLDMATGATSRGNILHHGEIDRPLEPGWALDADGEPTTDPLAARLGAISPFGAGKGYGLGLALELLVAVLTGSALGRDVRGTLDTESVCNKGDLFLCLDPERFGAIGSLAAVSDYLAAIRATPPQQGVDAVRVPGDRSRRARQARAEAGFEVPDAIWATACTLASVVGSP